MNISDLFDASENFPDLFAAHETFVGFAASLDGSKPGIGRVWQHIAEKYPDHWERAYRTIKRHGFVSKALALPDADSVTDIVKSAELVQSGSIFTMSRMATNAASNAGFTWAGQLGARYDWSPEWLKRGERLKRRTGGIRYYIGATPSDAVAALYPAGGDWSLATLEAIQRDDGRFLVIGRTRCGIGSDWLAILPPGSSLLPLLSEHEHGEIAAEEARMAETWGAPWRVMGTDKAIGALGTPEHFDITVRAHNRDDAWQAAYNFRTGKGFGFHFMARSVEPVGSQ